MTLLSAGKMIVGRGKRLSEPRTTSEGPTICGTGDGVLKTAGAEGASQRGRFRVSGARSHTRSNKAAQPAGAIVNGNQDHHKRRGAVFPIELTRHSTADGTGCRFSSRC